jgi:hypothetical protein
VKLLKAIAAAVGITVLAMPVAQAQISERMLK